MIYDMRDMLRHARAEGQVVASFELLGLDFLGGVLDAAQAVQAPVILGLCEARFRHGRFDLMMPSVLDAARRAGVPVAIHLERGRTIEAIGHALDAGCNGVMIDAPAAE
ncbi:MAG: class II fructose-bisphosphate aldolase, partial [Alphaproteobacteria bacterium]|nr:class II fructose-bisphosphate aldolase [Alphaproteobacteria bacterium]